MYTKLDIKMYEKTKCQMNKIKLSVPKFPYLKQFLFPILSKNKLKKTTQVKANNQSKTK